MAEQKKSLLRRNIKNALCKNITKYRNYELGLMLSGGFDSSLLCKLATEICGRINTFTMVYEPYNIKTVMKSREVSRIYGTKHKEITFTVKDYAENFSLLASYLDEPAFDRNLPIIYHILNNIPSGTKFIMYGFGGDEIFGDRLEETNVEEIYNYANIKKMVGIDKRTEIVYLNLITKFPQKLLIHNRISSLLDLKITFPFLDYEVVKLGLRLPPQFRRNKYLLKTVEKEVLKLHPINNRENSYKFLVVGRKVLENYYRDEIQTSPLLKTLLGINYLKLILQNRNENDILKLILFQLWFNNAYK